MHKVFTKQEDAVAGAVTVVLVIALVSILMAYYVSVVVPSTMSQYEYTMDQGITASMLQFSSDMVSMESTGTIGAVDFQNFILESGSIPVMSSPSYASLSFTSSVRSGPFSYSVYANDKVTGLPTSTFYGGGGMEIVNGNRFYSPGFLYYEGGAIYETNSVNANSQSPISLPTVLEYSPGTNTYYFYLFNIYGTAQEVTSGSVDLEIEYSGTSALSTTLTQGIPVDANFTSPNAAMVFYQGAVQLFGSNNVQWVSGSHNLDVTFTIPSGVNVEFSVSSFAISEYGLVK
jgi:hypothetical protein